ncbi:MAG TPA: hypothetical protein VE999_00240 [Gemmataceae bacterium]|nr:hypothetical protein [Gemmataceae bacterium]
MPAVEIDSPEQYSKALAVLTEVGGTFHGVGGEKERTLLVTEAQYRALVAAGVVTKNGAKERGRGKKKAKRDGAA